MDAPALDEARILHTLRQVVDPELGCNIVDLGLIYGVTIAQDTVTIEMTLTTPGCPMHESLTRGVETALLELAGVQSVTVHLVWDPPWNPDMMTDAGRAVVF